MQKIFVSYRRSDNPDAVGRIYDRLVDRFGKKSVFIDIHDVPFGIDFRKHVDTVLKVCDVALIVIGPKWLELDQNGEPRINDPKDFVRIEVEAVLERAIPVIPVLVAGASLPSQSELPGTLSDLVFRNASTLESGANFSAQMSRLIGDIETSVSRRNRWAILLTSLAMVLVAATGVWLYESFVADVGDDLSASQIVAPENETPQIGAYQIGFLVLSDEADIENPWVVVDESTPVSKAAEIAAEKGFGANTREPVGNQGFMQQYRFLIIEESERDTYEELAGSDSLREIYGIFSTGIAYDAFAPLSDFLIDEDDWIEVYVAPLVLREETPMFEE